MKNVKKILAVMTAAASLCATSVAFADTAEMAYPSTGATLSNTGTKFDLEKGVLDVVNPNTVDANSETTILVLNSGANDTNVADKDILYINQKNTGSADDKNFTGAGLKMPTYIDAEDDNKEKAYTNLPGSETGISYPVKVGYYENGSFKIASATIVVKTGSAGKTVTWGDIDLKNGVDVNDASAILNSLVGGQTKYGDYTIGTAIVSGGSVLFGDVDLKNGVDVNDASAILNSLVGGQTKYGDYTIGVESVVK